ncbi:SdpI family protein [Corynebacterium sanguinis]|nr:SdpI family protein [Corynebacterium sanguinis]MCT2288936.1 SdpI family protein [Corynebacterium sanguinis]
MTANLVVGIIYLVLAVVLVVVGAMSVAGKLPGNSIFGLRIAAVRKDKAIWDQAHKVAGPFVLFAGVALAFGAAFAFIAAGWMWVAPVVALAIAVVALSVAGNFGARAATLVDAARNVTSSQGQEPQAAPQVNLDALRNAAAKADGGKDA